MLKQRITCIEVLSEKGTKTQSLGVIEPSQILNYSPMSNPQYLRYVTQGAQTDLFGEKAIKLEIPTHKYQYHFRDDPYRKLGRYKDEIPFPTYIIVGVVYPKKTDLSTL